MNFTEILREAGIPEPPGREQIIAQMQGNPWKAPKEVIKEGKRKAREAKPVIVKAGPSSKSRRRYV